MIEIIINRYSFPVYKGKITNYNVSAVSINELCGDIVEVFLDIRDNKLVSVGYEGRCCTISQGVLEIVIDRIIGKSLYEIKRFDIKELESLIGKELLSVRTKCALIGIETIKKAISKYEGSSSIY
ncbi:MAG: iron-sulfur cluster assembly scaffold protein [candidate division WOR-3 bacterium]|nr:iron-sulfur cluster assembly scaffold protein [candidate division WOR-3 bacterium]MCX7948388.1 iron-sulfur cluster assembly scaffold protein [candidate division WOR-3 bacterium]MDW8151172.1 iron-sulfur cluster assembly scaffold protein [candidate division WOR-3 bacterium]